MSDLPSDDSGHDDGPLPLDDEGAETGAPPDDHAADTAGATGTGDAGGAPSPPPPAPAPAAPRPSPTHVRAFVAVNFPIHVVRRIADEAAALRAPLAAAGLKVRWVPAANLHVTLKFLGPIKVAAIEAITARLVSGLREAGPRALGPFDLEARGLGAFPSVEQPRVLWAGVAGSPALAALQQEVEGWLAELGFPRDDRPYHPHVTIGRVGDGVGVSDGQGGQAGQAGQAGQGDLASIFAERGGKSFGGGRVTEVVLYEARTLAKGAEYHALSRVPLPRS